MIRKKITLKKNVKDHEYTALCNRMEKQGVFLTCGSPDDKWIIGQWEDEIDFFAWSVSMGIAKIVDKGTGSVKWEYL